MTPRWSLALVLLATACAGPVPTTSPLGKQAGGRAYDGVYGGNLVLDVGVSPESCPRAFGHPVTMVVRDGVARIDVARGEYFNGNVNADGHLTMISGAGRAAFLPGQFTNGVFTISPVGSCHYQGQLTKQAAAS